MSRPETRRRRGRAPDPLDDGAPDPGGRVRGLQRLRRGMPHPRHHPRAQAGLTPLAPRQGPIARPSLATAEGGWIPLSAVTREVLKPTTSRRGAGPTGRPRRPSAGEDRAPCQVACPAGTDAGRYVGLIAQGRYDEAYAVSAEVNPFPSVCGWICTAPCEAACRRGTLDEPIAIRTLKRFAAEHGTLPPIEPPRRSVGDSKVAIVGGGPAGMSAAYYLARLGYPVTVFEAMPVPGGMMAIGIPEYRLPREVLRAEIDRILGLGVELQLDRAMGRDFSLADLETDRVPGRLPGDRRDRRAGAWACPATISTGVVPATLFLKQVNLGEDPRLAGDVVVVGGGSTAMDAARSAIRSGAAAGHGPLPARPRRDAGPGRGDRGGRARGRRHPRGRRRPEAVVGEGQAVTARPGHSASARPAVRQGSCWPTSRSPDGSSRSRPRPSSWRSARSPIRPSCPRAPGSRSAAGPASSPIPRTFATGRPGRVRRRRRRVRPQDDHRRGRRRPPGRRLDPRVPRRRRRTGRRRSCGRCAIRTAPGAQPRARHRDPAAGPRRPPRRRARLIPGRPAGVRRGDGPGGGTPAASAATRSPAVRRVEVTAGRGPADRRTIDRRRAREPRRSKEVDGDSGPGIRALRRGRELPRRDDRARRSSPLWLLVVALHLARPYMIQNLRKFSLRLGADLWWIVYVALRDLLLVQVFLGSFIFFYPDVVAGKDLPITGGLAAVCAFAVMLIKLMTRGDADLRWFRIQTFLLGLGATLYIVPVHAGRPGHRDRVATSRTSSRRPSSRPRTRRSRWPSATCPVCWSGSWPSPRSSTTSARPRPPPAGAASVRGAPAMTADELANALTIGRCRLARPVGRRDPADPVGLHPRAALRPPVHHPVPRHADAALRRRRLVAVVRPDPRRADGPHPRPEHDLPHAEPVHRAGPADHRTAGDRRPAVGARRQAHPRLRRRPGGVPARERPPGHRLGALHRPPDLRPRGGRPGRCARLGRRPRLGSRARCRRATAPVPSTTGPGRSSTSASSSSALTAAALFGRFVMRLGRPDEEEAPPDRRSRDRRAAGGGRARRARTPRRGTARRPQGRS